MIKMKPVTYCDKCENEIDSAVSFDDMDFCQNCYADLKGLINGWLHPIEPSEEEPIEIEIPEFIRRIDNTKTLSEIKAEPNKSGKPKKVKTSKCTRKNGIDWDKACALKLAGRSNAWIADELGISPGTVGVCICKKVKEYQARKEAEAEEIKRKVLEA